MTQLSNQSPYVNGLANAGASLYNQKFIQKPKQFQQHQNLPGSLNLEQVDQFRQVNSYSVDRVGASHGHSSFTSAIKKSNIHAIGSGGASTNVANEGSTEQENSFESLTNSQSKNSLSNVIPPPSFIEGSEFSNDYTFKSHQQQNRVMQTQIKSKNQFQLRPDGSGANTVPIGPSSFTLSNKKPLNFDEEAPHPMKSSQTSSNYHQSPILQSMISKGMIQAQMYGGGSIPSGFQDLFFDDTTQSTTESLSNHGNQQKLWSQQMILQQQQSQKSAYALSQLSATKNSIPSQQLQYSKSRDGGYRNIPTRDLASINEQAFNGPPQSEVNHLSSCLEEHPFKRPKLHLFKKDASRRIKTSSATRNLQPIYPLEGLGGGGSFNNNKLYSNNFNSIQLGAGIGGGGGTTTASNPPPLIPANQPDPKYYYHANYYQKNLLNVNLNAQGMQNDQENFLNPNMKLPQSQLIMRKGNNPFVYSANHCSESGPTTLDASERTDPLLPGARLSTLSSIPDPETIAQRISQVKDQLQQQRQSSKKSIKANNIKDDQLVNIASSTNLQNDQNDGFKHSFYVDKDQNKPQSTTQDHLKNTVTEGSKKILASSETNIKENNVGGGVKQIFVLNVNAASNTQSIQESKAMTPCFLHTPNMTNKWNDFKPQPIEEEQEQVYIDQTAKQQSYYIHHQANPSQQSDFNPMNTSTDGRDEVEPDMPLFTRSKVNVEASEGIIYGEEVLNNKKPMTSHQQSKSGNSKKPINPQKSSDCSIKLLPQDIYLQSSTLATGTTKGSTVSQSSKPSTSGSSFRRPLSRNHPMLNLVSKSNNPQNQTTDGGINNNNISLKQGENNKGLLILNAKIQSKTMQQQQQQVVYASQSNNPRNPPEGQVTID